jgi:hypothetical protein
LEVFYLSIVKYSRSPLSWDMAVRCMELVGRIFHEA